MTNATTYTLEHLSKGVIQTGMIMDELRRKAFKIRSNKKFSFTADADYYYINEQTNQRNPLQYIN